MSEQQFDICVVGGAGHVGLPLALVFAAKNLNVAIYDINQNTLKTISEGKMPWLEEGAQPVLEQVLASERLHLFNDPTVIARSKTVIVTIGTPVDEFLNPVHRVVRDCLDDLLDHFRDGQLLILRSTVFPGTTEWLARRLDESGKKIKLAFCPERIVQGFAIKELQGMPQIVSGATPEAALAAHELFGLVAPETIELKPMEAEFAKLFNNCYRYIQFSIANQFYMIAESAGVDYLSIHHAMTHHYPRAKDMPLPGFTAGPCLFKDTMQLAAFSRNQFALGHAAMLVNEGMVLYVIERMRAQYDLEKMTVGILGMAFKANSDDRRASLSYKLKKALALHAKAVLTSDPLVSDDPELLPMEDVIAKSDVLILGTPHREYAHLDTRGKPIFDVWHYLDAKGC
ncbi:MAG: nucleotide sugar dehydrogenase [Alphaproteobacteria bacterium]|nr:nucleotide sugar dehydrogenase [Alphaproteobacteria bacterium]